MGGLDYTNQTPATDGAAASQDTAYTQVNTPKNKYLPTGISAGALSPQQTNELLANMQRMIEQRTGAWNTMMGGIQDALAFTAPVANGQQAVALQYRNEQKRKEAEELMGMQTAMASVAGQQQLSQNIGKQLDALTAGGAGGAGGADVVGGVGGAGDAIPDTVLRRIAALRARGNNIGAAAVYDEYLKTKTNERIKLESQPGYFEQKKYQIPGYGEEMLNVPEYEKWRSTGYLPDGTYAPPPGLPKQPASKSPGLRSAAEGAPQMQSDFAKFVEKVEGSPEGSVSPKGATTTMQVMPKTAMKPGYGVRPAADDSPEEIKRVGWDYADAMKKRYAGDEEAALIAYNAGPVVADKFLKAGRDPAVLPKETVNYLARATELRNQKPTQEASAGAPVSDAVSPPKRQQGEPLNVYQSRLKQWEELQTQKQKGTGVESEESAKYASKLLAHGADATPLLEAARRIRKHAEEHPEDFNVASKGGWYGTAINAARVIGGETRAEDVKQGLKPYAMSQESISRQEKSQSDAVKLGIASTAELFAGIGARIGAQIESLGQQQKGVGIDMTAQTNILNAKLTELGLERAQKVAAAWPAWRDAHPGKSVYDMLLNSPTGKEINDWTEQQLKDRFPETGKPVTPQNAARAERERREAARKGQQ